MSEFHSAISFPSNINSQTSFLSGSASGSSRRLPTPQVRVQHQLVIDNARRDLVTPFRSKIYTIFKFISNFWQFIFLSFIVYDSWNTNVFCGVLPALFIILILTNTCSLSFCFFHRLLFLSEYIILEEADDNDDGGGDGVEQGPMSMMREISPLTKISKKIIYFFENSLFLVVLIGTFSLLSDECARKSPKLFSGIATLIAYNILISLLPMFIFILFICFLPFVIMFLRFTHKEPSNGINEDDLTKIPSKEYHLGETFYKENHLIEEEDATCSICLQIYEEGILLRILGCGHHFHKSCSDEWFKLQATCPLCVRPVIDKRREEIDNEEDIV